MSQDKSQKVYSWKKELKEIFLISLIGIPWGYFMCRECGHLLYSMIVSASIWIVLWKGNDYLSYYMDLKYQWLKHPVHRLVLGIIGHTVLTTLAIIGIFYFYQFFMNISIGNIQSLILIGIGVTFIMTIILQSVQFLISWRQLAVESERMNKEMISAKYEALKNQVNPHFLFNSFNVLTNLVYEDQDTAAKFIKKLSDVYRYVLDSREKELVSLKEEMNFVKSYIFLQKMRHNEGLNIEIDIPHAHTY
jgi:sensor histidine kinase YesM